MTSSPHRAVDRRRPPRPLRLQGAVLSAALILTAGVVLPKASDAAVGPAIPQAPAPACIPAIGIAPSYVLGESAADLDRDLAAARELGSSRYRFDVDWSVVERSRGSYDWAPVDRVVNAVLAAGLTHWGFWRTRPTGPRRRAPVPSTAPRSTSPPSPHSPGPPPSATTAGSRTGRSGTSPTMTHSGPRAPTRRPTPLCCSRATGRSRPSSRAPRCSPGRCRRPRTAPAGTWNP